MSDKPGLLVTGASGFVGQRAIALGRSRFNIIATGRGKRPDWLPADAAWCAVDLLDRRSVARLPVDIPFVLHLASETVPSKFSDYEPLVDSVEMTLNLCRHLRSGRLLFASSCLVYGASQNPLTEEDPVDPRGNYGLAKAMCENIVLRASGIDAVVARPFNHIGAGMRPDLVIPSIIRRVRDASDGTTIEMAGLNSIRDFLDVDDIIEAYFAVLMTKNRTHSIFNVASGVAISISDITRMIAAILNKQVGEIAFAAQRNSADDTPIMVGASQRLRLITGWAPRYDGEQTLRRLIAGSPDCAARAN
ncbi:NAD-dependent epimerase/dehydratase family protein [Sphingobium bisphenolivorans]|uniref:NAD-dependent epimerase/dehydratase family protein n=1 Tax=Sphingobium bisphenolivorans TaxID=1335760 RepID=UPI001EE6D18B|nr:NAD(P)-dependent oxidoreductase [Sphingobium bisphenolivorans]